MKGKPEDFLGVGPMTPKIKGYFRPQEMVGARCMGNDYGVPGQVILRNGHKVLVWRRGHTYWASKREPRVWGAATLTVENHDPAVIGRFEATSGWQVEMPKMSTAKLQARVDEIAEAMGLPGLAPEQLNSRKTFVAIGYGDVSED